MDAGDLVLLTGGAALGIYLWTHRPGAPQNVVGPSEPSTYYGEKPPAKVSSTYLGQTASGFTTTISAIFDNDTDESVAGVASVYAELQGGDTFGWDPAFTEKQTVSIPARSSITVTFVHSDYKLSPLLADASYRATFAWNGVAA